MRSVLGWLKSAGAVCLGFCLSGSIANAAVIVNFSQSGLDVIASVTGSVGDLGSPDITGSGFPTPILQVQNTPSYYNYFEISDSTFNGPVKGWAPRAASSQKWGNGNVSTVPDIVAISATGSFYFDSNYFVMLSSYIYGTNITGTLTFKNKTLLSLGIQNPATFSYTFGNGGKSDNITFIFGSNGGGSNVPEPASMAIFGLGALGMAYRARRKTKA